MGESVGCSRLFWFRFLGTGLSQDEINQKFRAPARASDVRRLGILTRSSEGFRV